MPNIKSAKKRVKQMAKRHARNVARKTAIKTAIKKVELAIQNKEIERAKELLKNAEGHIARAKSKSILHPNTAARKISSLAKKVSAIQKAAQ